MAQQMGIVPLQGTIGNITFMKTKDGFMARQKGGVSKERIASDPAFQRTRENGAEFGRAGKAGKLLRNAIRSLLINTADARMVARLTREFVKVIQADMTNARGQRNVIDGEAELLQGFDFNANAKLSTTLFAPFTSTINRATGELTVSLPSFIPLNMIAAPAGATHFKLTSAGVEINFEQQTYTMQTQLTAELPWDSAPTALVTLTNSVTAASASPLFLAVGIEFFQQVNGNMYSLKNGAFNALSLVAVSGS